MVFRYFAEDDMLYIELAKGVSTESEEVATHIVFDYDADGRVIGIEIEDASLHVDLTSLELSALPLTEFAFNRQAEPTRRKTTAP